jgi:carnitine 3-dehydrogenase
MTARGRVFGWPQLTPEVRQKHIDGVHAEVGSRSFDELAAERAKSRLGCSNFEPNPAAKGP